MPERPYGYSPESQDFAREQKEEKLEVGPLRYTRSENENGRVSLDFGSGYDIGFLSDQEAIEAIPEEFRRSFMSDDDVDLRDLVFFESGSVRGDNNMVLPDVELEANENGLIYFTLPKSGVRMAIKPNLDKEHPERYHDVAWAKDAEDMLEQERKKKGLAS